MGEEYEIVKQGTWLYAGEVVCDLRVVKSAYRYGSGDYEDEPAVREDEPGEFYYVQYGSTARRGSYPAASRCCASIEEALDEARTATHGTVVWDTDQAAGR